MTSRAGREIAVAIDGPAGAGKSTVARLVAQRLGYVLVDTGALYRAVALAAKDAGADWGDEAAVGTIAEAIAARDGLRFHVEPGGAPKLHLDGRDVSAAIRAQDIAQGASRVSALPRVRAALLDMQRRGAREGAVVLEGRDIGTVVLPDAEAKVFLTASVEVRAKRRFDELIARGETPDLAEVEREVRERDTRDTTRPIAPLRQAEDALLLDSTAVGIDAVVDTIVAHVDARRAAAGER